MSLLLGFGISKFEFIWTCNDYFCAPFSISP